MTDGPKSSTEKFVAETGAEYPYGYDKGSKVKRTFGVSGIPHAVLVDSAGRIAWRGHPARLKGSHVEGALGEVAFPPTRWPDSAKRVKSSLAKRNFARAVAEAEKLDEPRVRAFLVDLVNRRVGAVAERAQRKDYTAVLALSDALESELKGLEQADELDRLVQAAKDDPLYKSVLSAQKDVQEARAARYKRPREAERALYAMRDLEEEFEGTAVETQAHEVAQWLVRVLNELEK